MGDASPGSSRSCWVWGRCRRSAPRPHLARPAPQHCRPPPARCSRSTRCGAPTRGSSTPPVARSSSAASTSTRSATTTRTTLAARRSVPVTGADWDRMAAPRVRRRAPARHLVRLEPTPGPHRRRATSRSIRAHGRDGRRARHLLRHRHAPGRVGQVHRVAARRGVPAGREPAIGWDGAPQWATITDGASTCTPGSREDSPRPCSPRGTASTPTATASWTTSSSVWGEVARELRARSRRRRLRPAQRAQPRPRHRLSRRASAPTTRRRSTRSAPARRAGSGFITPGVLRDDGLRRARCRSTSPPTRTSCSRRHNYGESIGDLPIEGVFAYFQALATQYDAPLWIGEYGWFSDPPAQRPKLARFAAKEDALLTAGDAWWQWRQACGDPHTHRPPRRHPRRGPRSTSSATAAPAT